MATLLDGPYLSQVLINQEFLYASSQIRFDGKK